MEFIHTSRENTRCARTLNYMPGETTLFFNTRELIRKGLRFVTLILHGVHHGH